MSDPVHHHRAIVANAVRRGDPPAVVDDARRDLYAAKLERAIRETLAKAPPLSDEQRRELARILTGGAR